ncbi:hypothetical protein HK101_005035 [Irineochytrium annulatum]|nr:hypothetical protein HK101_005035 [Irineochytrium annulatum]
MPGDRQPYQLYPHQVAGHQQSLYRVSESAVLKETSAVEVAFYNAAVHTPLLPFIPRRLPEVDVQRDKARKTHRICMEDLLRGFMYPCVIDVKIGSRLYGDDADEAKKARMEHQSRTTTSGSNAIRICGMKAIPRGVVKCILEKLDELVKAVETSHCRLYSCSVLVAYDGSKVMFDEEGEGTTDSGETPQKKRPKMRNNVDVFLDGSAASASKEVIGMKLSSDTGGDADGAAVSSLMASNNTKSIRRVNLSDSSGEQNYNVDVHRDSVEVPNLQDNNGDTALELVLKSDRDSGFESQDFAQTFVGGDNKRKGGWLHDPDDSVGVRKRRRTKDSDVVVERSKSVMPAVPNEGNGTSGKSSDSEDYNRSGCFRDFVIVRLIDFAHSHFADNIGPDLNALNGLANLRNIFAKLLSEEPFTYKNVPGSDL